MEENFEAERQKQLIKLRQRVMKAEQQRLADEPSYSMEEVVKILRERMKNQIEPNDKETK